MSLASETERSSVPFRAWDDYLPVPAGTVCEVRSFVGWDRGSLGEANLELNVGGGYRLYERSEHKETDRDYDAWTPEDAAVPPAFRERSAYVTIERAQLLHFHTGAAMTGPRTNDGGLSTRVQFSIRLRMSKTGVCDGPRA